MGEAPKTRRFLARNKTWAGDGRGNWTHTGYQWVEAFWDGKKYRVWCGNPNTLTTNSLDFDEWAELPQKR